MVSKNKMNHEVQCECCQAADCDGREADEARLLALLVRELSRELARVKRENRRLEAAKRRLCDELLDAYRQMHKKTEARDRSRTSPLCQAVRDDCRAHQQWNREVLSGAIHVGLSPEKIKAALFGRDSRAVA